MGPNRIFVGLRGRFHDLAGFSHIQYWQRQKQRWPVGARRPVRYRSELDTERGFPIIGCNPVVGEGLKNPLHSAADAWRQVEFVDFFPEIEQHRKIKKRLLASKR